MDDVTAAKEKQRPAGQSKGFRKKYMDQLQEVVDRKRNEILIELDDLDNVRNAVRITRILTWLMESDSMRKASARIWA